MVNGTSQTVATGGSPVDYHTAPSLRAPFGDTHTYTSDAERTNRYHGYRAEQSPENNVYRPRTNHLDTIRDISLYEPTTGTTEITNHITYDSFGNVTSETNTSDPQTVPTEHLFGFTRRPFDEATGLQNNLNRWYDAAIGQWLSEDPIGFDAGDANLHRYVANRPVQSIDPTGLAERFPGPTHILAPQRTPRAWECHRPAGDQTRSAADSSCRLLGRSHLPPQSQLSVTSQKILEKTLQILGETDLASASATIDMRDFLTNSTVFEVWNPFGGKERFPFAYTKVEMHSGRLRITVMEGPGYQKYRPDPSNPDRKGYPFDEVITGQKAEVPGSPGVRAGDRDSCQIAIFWSPSDKWTSNAVTKPELQENENRAAKWNYATRQHPKSFDRAYTQFDVPRDATEVTIVVIYTDSLMGREEDRRGIRSELGDVPIVTASWTGRRIRGEWKFYKSPGDVTSYVGAMPTVKEIESTLEATRSVAGKAKHKVIPRDNRVHDSLNTGYDLRPYYW